MKNPHSSDGIAEDMIRSITQLACAELHTKTLIEKTTAELENGMVDLEEANAKAELLVQLEEELEMQAELRRSVMRKLMGMYNPNPHFWCTFKHLCTASFTLFEAYQASDRDEELYQMWLESNKALALATSHFLGVEVTSCSACLSEALTKGELNAN